MSASIRQGLLDELAAQRGDYLLRVRRWPGAAVDAEDVIQEAFLRAMAAAERLRDEAHANEWFFRVLRSAYVDQRRRIEARRRLLAEMTAEVRVARQLAPDPPELRCACLRRALVSLPPPYRNALEVVELDGRPLGELASAAGITPNNAGVRIHRARAALARVTRACCHGCRSSRDGCTCGV